MCDLATHFRISVGYTVDIHHLDNNSATTTVLASGAALLATLIIYSKLIMRRTEL